MKVIFLDIDGVLNCQDAYHKGECLYVKNEETRHMAFYSESKRLLNQLIDLAGAKVVISSTWRNSGLEWMKEVWKFEGMSGEIIGVTPNLWLHDRCKDYHYTIPRGCEIEAYLEKDLEFHHINWSKKLQQEYMNKSGIENYIIIDDDGDMLYEQRNHFVHVLPSPRNTSGFNNLYYEKALWLLSKNVIELNYKD